ncbi:MAG: GNAT family N-acetyltransferase [Methyloversatilis sp.]|jgi:GNAT superfamily N-acetyltransferase|nr:GNAT family N-acetyltransferase [Methyloversatilis sp.]MBP6193273.1 GNAT family N-acetyltransferase [Methyloversatilis sp.]MBP9117232.1 GNAT family N-acetyltransferase [Methyloversatilis sp.]
MADIRPATTEDLPVLCALLDQLFAQEVEFTPDTDAQTRGLRRIIESPAGGDILVTCEHGTPIGMVNLLYLTSTALGSKVALLEDMIIAPAHRGSGHGNRLLDAAIARARSRGCRRITLLTDGDNAIGQRFYARHGFIPSSMLAMRLMLD